MSVRSGLVIWGSPRDRRLTVQKHIFQEELHTHQLSASSLAVAVTQPAEAQLKESKTVLTRETSLHPLHVVLGKEN